MQPLTIFYLENCPYCRNARRALQELTAEMSAFAAVKIDWVEESRQPALAEEYDYYYVPSAFLGREKLYEAVPGESYMVCKTRLSFVLNKALQEP